MAGVWDGSASRLDLDGALVGELVADTHVQDEHGITLGAGNDNGVDDNFIDGALDEVRIDRRALAEDEVAALASALWIRAQRSSRSMRSEPWTFTILL